MFHGAIDVGQKTLETGMYDVIAAEEMLQSEFATAEVSAIGRKFSGLDRSSLLGMSSSLPSFWGDMVLQ